MNAEQITEIFIRAAQVDRKLPDTARPARLKAINHGYVHDLADVNGWDEATKNTEWRWKWLNPENLRNTTNDMGLWYAAMELVRLIPTEAQRRALWAWSRAEAGGQPFAKWCRTVENISRQTGNYRRNRAVECIISAFDRKPLQHNDFDGSDGFTDTPEINDKRDNIRAWLADDAKPALSFDESLQNFDWAEAQNARRRERDARKRQAA